MTDEDVEQVARMLIERHGRGASLLAYQNIVRTVEDGCIDAARHWCAVLLEIEMVLNRREGLHRMIQ
jgi:hypothetical protein